MPDIFLYGGETPPEDIELRDPNVLDVDSTNITGTGAIAFQVFALAGTGAEAFIGTAAETFSHPLLAASGAERFTGTATETFSHPAIAGTGSNISAITGTGAVTFAHPAIAGGQAPTIEVVSGQFPLDYRRIPIKRQQPQKLERPVFVEPELPTPVRNDEEALVALYAAGVLNEEEFAALIAA